MCGADQAGSPPTPDAYAVRSWEGPTIADPLTCHNGAVTALAVGHVDGEAVVVSGGEDRTVRVWGIHDRRARRPMLGTGVSITALAVGPDGAILCGDSDGGVYAWDPRTGRTRFEVPGAHAAPITGLMWTQIQGRLVAMSGGADGRCRWFDALGGEALGELQVPGEGPIPIFLGTIEDSPHLIALGEHDDRAVWRVADGMRISVLEQLGGS